MKPPAIQTGGSMKTNILQELETASTEIQYDTYVKRILSNRYILAWIMKHTTSEFTELPVSRIAEECITDEVQIFQVPVSPGQTNAKKKSKGNRIVGSNTEDKVPEEGSVYFDIRFFAYVPNTKEPIKILLNVEAQKKFYVGYHLVTRGIFYAARMLSAQMETEFSGSDYAELKKVYSIWICMNAPDYIGNAIAEYRIEKTDMIEGIPDKRDAYDKMSVVMICLNRDKKDGTETQGIIRLLNTLLATDMDVTEKGEILSGEYDIVIDDEMGKELGYMSNLGEGIFEEAFEKGIGMGIKAFVLDGQEEGLSKERILMKLQKHFSVSEEDAKEYYNQYSESEK